MRISYFVFTNGEKGENFMDWGVKHSSAALGDTKTLNAEYTSLLSEFGMSPSLNDEIPKGGKVNILLLPHKNGSVMLGFVFPSVDHKQRPSNSTVICVIPDSLQEERVREIARRIWDSNDLPKIAARGTPRPDSLELNASLNPEAYILLLCVIGRETTRDIFLWAAMYANSQELRR